MTAPGGTAADPALAGQAALAAQSLQAPDVSAPSPIPFLLRQVTKLATIHRQQDAAIERVVAALFTAHGSDPRNPHFVETAHEVLPEIIEGHAQVAADVTAQWYEDLDPDSKFVAKPYVVDVEPERLAKSINWAIYAPGDEPPQARIAGDAKRVVRNASRATVTRNAHAEGERWARFAQPDACSFCRALAVRGSGNADHKYLYHSDKSAIYRKSDGEKYHTNCSCEAVPIRGGQVWTPPEHMDGWRKEYNAAARVTPNGPKYFQRIVAQMRANEPPTEEQLAKNEAALNEKLDAAIAKRAKQGSP